MAEEIASENGRITKFQGLMTRDAPIRHWPIIGQPIIGA